MCSIDFCLQVYQLMLKVRYTRSLLSFLTEQLLNLQVRAQKKCRKLMVPCVECYFSTRQWQEQP